MGAPGPEQRNGADNATPASPRGAGEPLLPPENGHANLWTPSTRLAQLSDWLSNAGTAQLALAVLFIGIMSGIVAFVYSNILDTFVWFTWDYFPRHVVLPLWSHAAEKHASWPSTWVLGFYVPLISSLYGLVVGGSQRILGCPGDLPDTIGGFHKNGCVAFSQARIGGLHNPPQLEQPPLRLHSLLDRCRLPAQALHSVLFSLRLCAD